MGFLSADERKAKFFCHQQIRKEFFMNEQITKEQINTTIALALMKYLYNKGDISEKVYKKIIMQYGKNCIANS